LLKAIVVVVVRPVAGIEDDGIVREAAAGVEAAAIAVPVVIEGGARGGDRCGTKCG
jgi:hypothetical protein